MAYATFVDAEHRALLESGRIAQLERSQSRSSQSLTQLRLQAETLNRNTQSQLLSQIESVIRNTDAHALEDAQKLASLQAERARYLSTALTQYTEALSYCDGHEDLIYRFVSLWFTQHANDQVNTTLAPNISRIPSWKLIGAAHQLCARLNKSGTSQSAFQKALSKTIVRMAREHPYHMTFRLLSLRHGLPSQASQQHGSRRSSSVQSSQLSGSQLSRAEAGDEVLRELKRSGRLAKIISHLETAFAAYTQWAEFSIKDDTRFKQRKTVMNVPSEMSVLNLKDVPVPISTEELPIEKAATYATEKMVCIARYMPKFKTLGGLNLPKVSDCVGTDGKVYKQLVSPLFVTDLGEMLTSRCYSSKAAMTSDKTQSWSRSLSSSTVCSPPTQRLDVAASITAPTKSFLCLRALVCFNSSKRQRRF